ncbi:hypothetical protein DRE_03448 [Drechslerella stenobrocha 248]|uniref:Peroxin/Ferlin domain-containing protein n=1 Tax=Drechslerella stenobrocha 248 TaxID=1043628 RepID=W7HUC9_9PEZI|nr:hypothetical protein DRE_03448 [Drechslerella stenobrocha 248]
MAALDTPWLSYMSASPSSSRHPSGSAGAGPSNSPAGNYLAPPDPGRSSSSSPSPHDHNGPPTVAPFSKSPAPAERASYHQVFQKSPLLVSTPPQITKSLSQIYPYAKFANSAAGLLTWTTEDPWESFLLVASFWAVTLYGDVVIRWLGNVLIVFVLALGMFARRHTKKEEHPSLDDILDTIQLLSVRFSILTDPFSSLATFLSVGQSPTTATMGPTLITLFIRILFVSPIWIGLSSSPFNIITPRRVVMFVGTTFLSWHSRPARVTRTILWRSALIRDICERITGLNLTPQEMPQPPPLPPRLGPNGKPERSADHHRRTPSSVVASHFKNKSSPLGNLNQTRATAPGVRFTFSIYENQRRWLGVGWTSSLFAYERPAWTDEHLSACPPVDEFVLPGAKSGMNWKWVDGQIWQVEGEEDSTKSGNGWVYYDNKWRNGKRGVDSWSAYTRRRRWYRNAELVEEEGRDDYAVEDDTESTAPPTVTETEEAPR